MNKLRFGATGTLLLVLVLSVISCSKETTQPQPPAASQPAAQPAAQSAPQAQQPAAEPAAAPPQPAATSAATAARPAGIRATEKYSLSLANYSKTAVTVSLNGAWIGQWDANTSVPLDQVVVGKNDLTAELADTPKNEVRLEIWTKRDGQDVNLLRLNFQDKPKGTYNYAFAAR